MLLGGETPPCSFSFGTRRQSIRQHSASQRSREFSWIRVICINQKFLGVHKKDGKNPTDEKEVKVRLGSLCESDKWDSWHYDFYQRSYWILWQHLFIWVSVWSKRCRCDFYYIIYIQYSIILQFISCPFFMKVYTKKRS